MTGKTRSDVSRAIAVKWGGRRRDHISLIPSERTTGRTEDVLRMKKQVRFTSVSVDSPVYVCSLHQVTVMQ